MTRSKESLQELTSSKNTSNTYTICVYANNDVYSETVTAARVGVTENAIILYDKSEKIVAIYPLSCSSLLRS